MVSFLIEARKFMLLFTVCQKQTPLRPYANSHQTL